MRHLVIRAATGLSTLACVACLLAPGARADGDPASDILVAANVFFPYQPTVSAGLMRRLLAETAAAARSGAPVKVALIASPVDLGAIPELFGQPARYARFLDQEISFSHRQPLLVVMAVGYGTAGLPGSAVSAVASLPRPGGRRSDALATAALSAVARIAAAEGHPLSGSAGSRSSSASGSGALVIGAAVAAALALLGAAGVARIRRRRRPG